MVEEIWDVESWEIFTDESDREESEIPAEKTYYPCREVLTKYCKTMMVYCKCPEDLCPYINKMTHLIHHNSHLIPKISTDDDRIFGTMLHYPKELILEN